MAFQGENSGAGVRFNETESLWALRKDTPQYWAWRYWMADVFRKRFFTAWLTVPFQWPPATQRNADHVAVWLSSIRDEIGGGEAVPRHPQPWSGIVPKVPQAHGEAGDEK
jgi:hypothetical protein